MGHRIIAQRILTHEIISWDVPLLDATSTRELSGPGGIYGRLTPVSRMMLGPDGKPLLREWATALYHEADGEIRAGGLVTRITEDDRGFQVEAPGFSGYPNGIPYLGDYQPGVGAEPLNAVRHIWQHVQSFPDGNLGVTLGDAVSDTVLDEISQETRIVDGEELPVEYHRPYRLSWWENRDCGQEISSLLELAPADFIEQHSWNADHTDIEHHIHLGTPTLGRRRTDLRFAEGENIVAPVPVTTEGEDFAQTVIGLGKGEGREMIRATVPGRDDRLRRVAVVTDKFAGQQRMEATARREQQQRLEVTGFERITVRDSALAPLSAIQPGDSILIEADLDWHGRTRLWQQVVSITEPINGNDIAEIELNPGGV